MNNHSVSPTTIYEELGRSRKFLSGWRYGVFAGFLVLIWGAYNLAIKALPDNKELAGLILIGSAILSIGLWIADIKTRDLSRKYVKFGVPLEGKIIGVCNASFEMRSHSKFLTYSFAVDFIFCLTLSFLIIPGCVLLHKDFTTDWNGLWFNIAIGLILIFGVFMITIGRRCIKEKKRNKQKFKRGDFVTDESGNKMIVIRVFNKDNKVECGLFAGTKTYEKNELSKIDDKV